MDVTEQAERLGERILSDQHAGGRNRGHQPERLIVVPVAALRLPPATFDQAFSLQEIRVRVLVQATPSPPLGANLGLASN
ncbi:MAG: hypothetical protein ACYTFA_05480 [Planctomycetota bacterium]|jgi:hypothetical protein